MDMLWTFTWFFTGHTPQLPQVQNSVSAGRLLLVNSLKSTAIDHSVRIVVAYLDHRLFVFNIPDGIGKYWIHFLSALLSHFIALNQLRKVHMIINPNERHKNCQNAQRQAAFHDIVVALGGDYTAISRVATRRRTKRIHGSSTGSLFCGAMPRAVVGPSRSLWQQIKLMWNPLPLREW